MNLTAVSSARSIQFSWLPPSSLNSTTIIVGYMFVCSPRLTLAEADSVFKFFDEAGSHSLEGFRPATEYNCSVLASNSAGNSLPARINVNTTDESKEEMSVTNLCES